LEDDVLTPEQRTLRAKIAINTRWANEDGRASAIRANKGLQAKFIRETHEKFPDLGHAELERRATAAFRAHMQRLALKSSKARAVRNSGGDHDAAA
jgi:hypothetical protein